MPNIFRPCKLTAWFVHRRLLVPPRGLPCLRPWAKSWCRAKGISARSPPGLPQEEAGYKLLKVKRNQFGKGGVPFIATHDGRTIRYPDPDIKVRSGLGAVHPFLCNAHLCLLLADVRPGQCLTCAEQITLCKATFRQCLLQPQRPGPF